MDNYGYENIGIYMQFGRFDSVEDEDEALKVIEQETGVSVEDMNYESTRIDGYPALRVTYLCGENEDTNSCLDTLVLGEDALHWFHAYADADWMDEDVEDFLNLRNEKLYLQEISEEMLLSLKAGQAAPVLYSMMFDEDNHILLNDITFVYEEESDEELRARGVKPEDIERAEIVYGYTIANQNEDRYIPYTLYEKGIISFIEYGENMTHKEYLAEELQEALEERRHHYADTTLVADVFFVGDIPVRIEQTLLD